MKITNIRFIAALAIALTLAVSALAASAGSKIEETRQTRQNTLEELGI